MIEETKSEKLTQQVKFLIREASKKGGDLYSNIVNNYLIDNCKVMLPLSRERWPAEFSWVVLDDGLFWPKTTQGYYVKKVFGWPFINENSLFFGYAIIGGKLKRTAFYVPEELTKSHSVQELVVDPIAEINGVVPDYYIGCFVGKMGFEAYLNPKRNPLEFFVSQKTFKKQKSVYRNINCRATHHSSFSDGLDYLS